MSWMRMIRVLPGFFLVTQLWASGETWSELQRTVQERGLGSRDAVALIERCEKNGLSVEDARKIVAPIESAVQEGLPAALLVERALEGVTKRVDPPRVATAVQERARQLATARDMVQARTRTGEGGAERNGLEEALVFALESGMPPETIRHVLDRGVERSDRQLTWVIEAGESLALSGFEPEETESLMIDCLERDLRRSEMLRATQYSRARHREGMRFRDMRQSLWGNGAGPRFGFGGGMGGGGANALGPGANRGTSDQGAATGTGSGYGSSAGQGSAGAGAGPGSGGAGRGYGGSDGVGSAPEQPGGGGAQRGRQSSPGMSQ